MEDSPVTKYYRVAAVVTFLASIVMAVTYREVSIGERIFAAVLLNFGFHLMYFFIGRMPLAQIEMLERNKFPVLSLARLFVKFLAIFAMFAAVVVIVIITFMVVSDHDYQKLFIICPLAGLFLGGYSLRIRLIEREPN